MPSSTNDARGSQARANGILAPILHYGQHRVSRPWSRSCAATLRCSLRLAHWQPDRQACPVFGAFGVRKTSSTTREAWGPGTKGSVLRCFSAKQGHFQAPARPLIGLPFLVVVASCRGSEGAREKNRKIPIAFALFRQLCQDGQGSRDGPGAPGSC